MKIIISITVLLFSLLLSAEDDPCTPKKVKGEWVSSLSAGANVARGNARTTLFSGQFDATKEDDKDIWTIMGSGARGDQAGVVNQNIIRGDANYKHLLDESWYLGGGLQYLRDQVADVRYRAIINPTVGYFFINEPEVKTLRLEVGPSYLFEQLGETKNNYLAPRAGERFEWKISPTAKIFQSSDILLSADDKEKYIWNNELGVEAALTTRLALVLTARDRYENQPAADRLKNDFQLISSLKVLL